QAALDNQAKRRQFCDLVLMYVNISRPESDLRPSGERQGEGRADGPLSLRQKHGAGKQARAAYGGGIIVRQGGQRLVEQEGVRPESQGQPAFVRRRDGKHRDAGCDGQIRGRRLAARSPAGGGLPAYTTA